MRRGSLATSLALAGAGMCTGAWMSANSLSTSAPSSQIQAFAAVGRAPAAPPKPVAPPVHLDQHATEQILLAAGVRWRSNGKCSSRWRLGCTSFEGIRRETIEHLLAFQQRSGCPITVSGGTEKGHAHGQYSHANGYKLDIMPGKCVDAFIEGNLHHQGIRGDGARMFRDSTGDTYTDEHSSHWDLLIGAEANHWFYTKLR